MMMIKYCSQCGMSITYEIPKGDNRLRAVCGSCRMIHYENPKMVVGCIPEWEDGRILLCRRAIEPRHGFWTLPAVSPRIASGASVTFISTAAGSCTSMDFPSTKRMS